MPRIRMDNNATTPVLAPVREAMARALLLDGNPSSVHASGREARALLAAARESVAALLGASPAEVVFTSGGTEADNLGLLGGARAAVAEGAPRRIVLTAVEHPAVEDAAAALEADGFAVARVAPDAEGVVGAEEFAGAVAADGGAAAAAMILLQNETGAILPVAEAFAAVRAADPRVRLHADAVQALGRLPFRAADLGADTVAVSAHKIHGPKGVGALWCAPGREPRPRAHGGKQERGLRTGTENLPGAAGFAAAADAARAGAEERRARAARVGALLEEGILAIPGARRNGPPAGRRWPGTLNVSLDGLRGDLLLLALDREGVEVSTGSACASGAPIPSRVLRAMGLGEERARGALRFSAGALTTEDEARGAVEALARAAARLRGGSGFPAESANPDHE